MAFNIGYVRLCDRNIRHIYTTTDIRQPAKRKPRPYKPEFLEEIDRKRRERLKNRRFMEYSPRHDIELPRAPAFRSMESNYVSGIVDRLTMPAKERFAFKYPVNDIYNDWRFAEEAKKMRLRETLHKFGHKNKKHKQPKEPETGQIDYVEKLPSIVN